MRMAILHCRGRQQSSSKYVHAFSLSLSLGCSIERRGRYRTSPCQKCRKRLKSAKASTVLHKQTLSWRQNPPWHTQAPRSFSRDIAGQLLHDAGFPSSASHLYLPCTLCTSLQAILLAFSQWWIWRSGIILDASVGSGATCNQPATDSWWLSHAAATCNKYSEGTELPRNYLWKDVKGWILDHYWSIFLDESSPLHSCTCDTSQLSIYDLCSQDLDLLSTSRKLLVTKVQFSAWHHNGKHTKKAS